MDGLTIRRTIKADFTPDQWGLPARRGRDDTARELNKALEQAVNDDHGNVPSIYADMSEYQSQLANVGADNDTGRMLVAQVVRLFHEVD